MSEANRREFKLSYANVMSTLCFFLVVAGGTALAVSAPRNSVKSKSIKDNTVQGRDVKNDNLTGQDIADDGLKGADVDESSLDLDLRQPSSLPPSGRAGGSLTGEYPNPLLAANAVGASELQSGAVGTAKLADGAVDGAKIADGSVSASDLEADEPFRVIGAQGEPPFGNGGDGDCVWSDPAAVSDLQPTSFYRDKTGRVHIAGLAIASDGAGGDGLCDGATGPETVEDFTIFTLPPGYRPDRLTLFRVSDGSDPVLLLIGADEPTEFSAATIPPGAVVAASFAAAPTAALLLDGASLRAAS